MHVPGPREAWFDNDYFSFNHGIGRAGIIADSSLRPADSPWENIFVCGGILANTEILKNGCGHGLALATGHAAAQVLHGVYSMNFEHCIRCTICVENCPVFRVNPDFPDRSRQGRTPSASGRTGKKQRMTGCFYAVSASAVKWPVPAAWNRHKSYSRRSRDTDRNILAQLAHLLFANNYYLSALGSFTRPRRQYDCLNRNRKESISAAMGISTYIPFPKFRFRKLHNEKKNRSKGRKKVAFFYGCFINFYRPDIGRKIIRLLSSLNVDVVLPPQWCCGLPALGNGNLKLARYFAEKNAASLSNYIDAGYDVIYTCTSCGLCLLHDYPGILKYRRGKNRREQLRCP
ncbi:MAG: heterodisulfide reductase-related iron-sulfur binding cluster [Desulfosudis oleivorans]|nr:heterodisulfide reductase-related iron-sulfur binding cluster [Desulfosudis oleivorans]